MFLNAFLGLILKENEIGKKFLSSFFHLLGILRYQEARDCRATPSRQSKFYFHDLMASYW